MEVRGNRVRVTFRGKHGIEVNSTVVDEELATAIGELLTLPKGSRVFRYEWEGDLYALTSKRLNDYVKLYLGPEFSAKDFRTWGGTLLAAIALAERAERHGFPETRADEKRSLAAVMRRVARELGNTPAVTRASYVSPAVVDQYLEGEPSRISDHAICVSWAHAKSASMPKNRRCSVCFVHGVFARRAPPHSSAGYFG